MIKSLMLAVCLASCSPPDWEHTKYPAKKTSLLTTMVSVPAGFFWMGCNAPTDANCRADEYPYHRLKMSAFEIDQTEVTQVAYQDCVAASICPLPNHFDPVNTPNLPVVDVSWQQASVYCGFVGKRLPTEAEWEKAARGVNGNVYPWGNTAATCAQDNFMSCNVYTVNVGTTTGNSPYGSSEMAGNVWEWVSDWYSASYYSSSPKTDPPGPATGTSKSVRGGSYIVPDIATRTSRRLTGDPTLLYDDYGFRCAR